MHGPSPDAPLDADPAADLDLDAGPEGPAAVTAAKLDAVLAKLDDLEAALLLGTGSTASPAAPLALSGAEHVAITVLVPISGEPLTLHPGETTPLPSGSIVSLTYEAVVVE